MAETKDTSESVSAAPSGPKDTVVVHGMPLPPGVPSLSPYVLKLETYLKIAKVPYEISSEFAYSSKGKIPWISYNDETVADSQFCVEWAKKKFNVDLNKGLTKEQKAVAHSFRIMLDEFQFWCNAYFRFYEVDDPVLVKFFPEVEFREGAMKGYEAYLKAQGVGRHSTEEILELIKTNIQAVVDYLGEKDFMMGDSPTDVDCSVFGILGVLLFYPPSGFQKHMGEDYIKKTFPTLYAYLVRIKNLTYPDIEW